MAAASHNKMLSAALTFTLSFCRLYMTKKTSDLPLNAKKHPYFRFESRGVCVMVNKDVKYQYKYS